MAKKNLKNALKAHEAKRSQAAKLKAVEEAAKRKAASIRPGNHHVKRQKKVERDQKSKKYVQPFRQEDTILLVGEGEITTRIFFKALLVCTAHPYFCCQAISPLHIHFCLSLTITIPISS